MPTVYEERVIHFSTTSLWRCLTAASISTIRQSREHFSRIDFATMESRLRLLKNYQMLGGVSTLAAGFRYYNGKTLRQHGFGFPGSEPRFDLFVPDVFRNLHFRNINLAGFAENIFRLTPKLSITPGFRFDHIDSTARGAPIVGTRKQSRAIPLFGLGMAYQVSEKTKLYANISQAYRATLFNDNWRPDPTIVVDPNLKDMTGHVLEYGWRGTHADWLHFDLGGFYLKYGNRLGLLTRSDGGGRRSRCGLTSLTAATWGSRHLPKRTFSGLQEFPRREARYRFSARLRGSTPATVTALCAATA